MEITLFFLFNMLSACLFEGNREENRIPTPGILLLLRLLIKNNCEYIIFYFLKFHHIIPFSNFYIIYRTYYNMFKQNML